MKTEVLVFLAVVLLDQISKFLAPKVGLVIVRNTGIAFGLFPNFCWGLVVLILLCLACFNLLRQRNKRYSLTVYYSLVLGGGFSNLFDRFYFGHIRDFIDLKFWPVFNLADVAVTCGVLLLLLKQIKVDKQQV